MEDLTVKQLKKLLDKYPENTLVGVIGHFGEFHPMDIYDFYLTKAYKQNERRYCSKEEIEVLSITVPNIGPEPD